jgi:molybdopterin/thiamine biosynthesis adenylyltransferase/proteasome lid subunit RPN8/RPN11
MSRLVLTSDLFVQLRRELLESADETCAILFGRAMTKHNRLARIVVREVQRVAVNAYQKRSQVSAQLRPEIVALAAQRSRKTGESLIFVHSHPFGLNEFSSIDDAGEKVLSEFFGRRTPGTIHATLLITPGVTIGRVLGSGQVLEVAGIGSEIVWGTEASACDSNMTFDRQVRAFGAIGQGRLKEMRVGIVGLGGTGSVVLEQLVHLGVRRFLLIDPDVVDPTNLNRLIGASELDVSKPKIEVASAHAKRINPDVEIEVNPGSVLLANVAEELVDTDFVFCCTDSQGSRAVLNQLAYQYLVPVIDIGVAVVANNGKVSHIAGRTQMLSPGLGCLVCGELLNPEAVRVDLLTEYERSADPYIIGAQEPAPAVISINSTTASLAVTMFLSAAIGIPSRARLINYNGITGITRAAEIKPHPSCVVCSVPGALARANEWPLPARLS